MSDTNDSEGLNFLPKDVRKAIGWYFNEIEKLKEDMIAFGLSPEEAERLISLEQDLHRRELTEKEWDDLIALSGRLPINEPSDMDQLEESSEPPRDVHEIRERSLRMVRDQ